MRIAVWLTSKDVACWNFSPENLNYLEAKLPQATVTVCHSRNDFLKALPTAEIVLTWSFEQEWFRIAAALRWIYTPAAGRDYFNIQPHEHVKVSYGSFHGEIIAETVLAMMLATCRGVIFASRSDEAWGRHSISQVMRPLRGANLTILGFGAIGGWIGRLAKPFGTHITGIKRHQSPAPDYFDSGDKIVTVDQLDKILPATDHLVLVLPRNNASELIIDRDRLAMLPSRAVIYNVGRGNAIDESALATALAEEKLAGACLDVFANEPLSEASPLRKVKNILLTPHSSAISPNYLELFIDEFAECFFSD